MWNNLNIHKEQILKDLSTELIFLKKTTPFFINSYIGITVLKCNNFFLDI